MGWQNQLALRKEWLPVVVRPEFSFLVPLPFCVASRRRAPVFVVLVQGFPDSGLRCAPEGQEEPAGAEPRVFGEREQLSVSLPISFVPRTLSPVHPMPSPGHPIPFSARRVVVQQLHLVFGTNRSVQKQSVRIEQELFSYHSSMRLFGGERTTRRNSITRTYRSLGVGEVADLTVTTSTASRRERWTLANTASVARHITIAAMSRIRIFGVRDADGFSVLSSGGFTTQYPSEHRKRNLASVQARGATQRWLS